MSFEFSVCRFFIFGQIPKFEAKVSDVDKNGYNLI